MELAVLLDSEETVAAGLAVIVLLEGADLVGTNVGGTDLVEVVLGLTREVGNDVRVPVVVLVDVFDAVDVYVCIAALSRAKRCVLFVRTLPSADNSMSHRISTLELYVTA